MGISFWDRDRKDKYLQEVNMEDERKTYLQMVQSTIERMSTTSAIFNNVINLREIKK